MGRGRPYRERAKREKGEAVNREARRWQQMLEDETQDDVGITVSRSSSFYIDHVGDDTSTLRPQEQGVALLSGGDEDGRPSVSRANESDGSENGGDAELDEDAGGSVIPPAFAIAALTAGFSCGYMTAIVGIVVPKVTADTHPRDAALVTGTVAALGSLANLAAPIVGRASDMLGSRRTLKLVGIVVCLLSYVTMLIGVVSSDYVLFAFGTVLDHIGVVLIITMLNVCCIDWGKGLRSTNALSGVNTLFQIAGAATGYLIAGAAFPIDGSNVYFYIGIVASALQILTVLVIPGERYIVHSGVIRRGAGSPAGSTTRSLLPRENDGDTTTTTTMKSTTTEDYNTLRGPASASARGAQGSGNERSAFLAKYRDLGIVTGVRFAFFMGIGALTNNLLYYIEDRIRSSEDPELDLSVCAVVALAFTVASLPPAIWLCGRIGTLKSVWASTLALCAILIVYPLNTSRAIVFVLSALLGSVQGISAVADLVLVGQCIPDQKDKARDIASWSVSQSLGLAIGSAIFGSLLNAIGKTDHKSADGGRVVYSAAGYCALFWTSAAILTLSSFALFGVRNKAAYATTTTSKTRTLNATSSMTATT